MKSELLDIIYDSPIKRKTTKSSGNNAAATEGWLVNNKESGSSERSTTLSLSFTNSKSWSHSFTMAVSISRSVTVSSPGKGVLGGAEATLGFDNSFSWETGWDGQEAKTATTTQTITETVPPKSRIKVKLFIFQSKEDIPYSATYKLHYSDGSTSTVKDKGVLKNVFFSTTTSESGPLEKL